MKYMGSKRRIFSKFKDIIASDLGNKLYVEPFVGGGNSICQMQGRRIGCDINPYVIEALKLIRDNPLSIPDLVSEDDYSNFRKNRKVDGITGYVAFSLSFGGKFFGGYRRDKSGSKGDVENMYTQSRRAKHHAISQSKLLFGVDLLCMSYDKIVLSENSVIYCDPPYQDTTKYANDFDHNKFFGWCEKMASDGHTVYLSEYRAPSIFEQVWEGTLSNTLCANGNKSFVSTEKLFKICHKKDSKA